jgi:hypothetical protein
LVPLGHFLACSLVLAGSPATAQEILVELTSGRSFLAAVDARTDESRLWLRFGDATAHILRPVAWDHVVRIQAEGRPISPDELRRKAAAQPKPVVPDLAAQLEQLAQAREPQPGTVVPPPPVAPFDRASEAPRVRALALEAWLANWDADVEADGLVVEAYPLDEFGQAIAVSGSLELELYGARRLTATRGEPLPLVSRWTAMLRADDVLPSQRVKLPFQDLDPEYDVALSSLGEVHGRLVVPGEGVFEATTGVVRIRAYSPIRDRRQQLRGSRFFPHDLTGGGRSLNSSRP